MDIEEDTSLYREKKESLSNKCCRLYIAEEEYLKRYPQEVVMVPLINIVNAVANISLIQTYQNPTQKFLELEYSFPVQPNNCIYRFTAEFGNSRIQGVVKEKEVAKEEYRQAVQSGKQAAYGEINEKSRDILTLRVGNVAPQQYVKVHISFMQQLTLSSNTFYQLRLPSTITPRYLAQLSPESVIAGYRRQKVEAKGSFTWTFKITLKTSRKVTFFDSHTHDLTLISQNDCATESVFALEKACVPNKDFVFTYTIEDYQLPSCVFGRTDSGSSAMLSFIPKFCTLSLDDAYKASVKGTPVDIDIENAKGEYIFLLDRSGSMKGPRIEKAKQALILFIKSLPADTFFNVISFGNESKELFRGDSVRYTNKNVETAVKQISKMTADMGGTQIQRPLRNQLISKPFQGYPKQIFLLTDGAISDTEKVVQMVESNNKFARVHTIGIGNGASPALIVGCAQKGKGSHVFINDSQDPSQKIIQLLTDSFSPVINRMKLKYDKNLVQSVIPNPDSLPYILKNEIVNFYITFKGQLDKSTQIIFSYEDSLNKQPFQAKITIDPESIGDPLIDRMGHYKRLRLLEDSFANNSQEEKQMYFVKTIDKRARIIDQSVKHQILSTLTAFVCVEKELIDGKFQEIQSKGKVFIEVKTNKFQQEQQEYQNESNLFKANYCQSYNPGSGSMKKCMQIQKSIPIKREMKQQQLFKSKFTNLQQNKQKLATLKMKCMKAPQKKKMMKAEECQFQDEAIQAQHLPKGELRMKQQLLYDKLQKQKQRQCEKDRKRSIVYNQTEKKRTIQPIKKESLATKSEVVKQEIMNINELIGFQSTEGAWTELSLVGKLYSQSILKAISKDLKVIAVITYLVAKWIEKYYPQKQYALVLKKALNYVKKQASNFEEYDNLYGQYLN